MFNYRELVFMEEDFFFHVAVNWVLQELLILSFLIFPINTYTHMHKTNLLDTHIQAASNEYPRHMFYANIKKIIQTFSLHALPLNFKSFASSYF